MSTGAWLATMAIIAVATFVVGYVIGFSEGAQFAVQEGDCDE